MPIEGTGVVKSFVTPDDGGVGGAGLPITDLISRVQQFGQPMAKDRVARHENPKEQRRHDELRQDIKALQDAIAVVNSLGTPAAPSYVLRHIDRDGDLDNGHHYRKVDHELGFTPDRWMVLDINGPGQGQIYAYRNSTPDTQGRTFIWDESTAYLAWINGGLFADDEREARIVFFRGGG
jgi:hypothetical protein